ncbi:ATP-dependent RNA helicase MRH4 mitochondrial [Spathaspora sp. JA1]|nr:ATP-dependent RNA helicase MRH4 mitochondrial [Spathaspora sp. JA1]
MILILRQQCQSIRYSQILPIPLLSKRFASKRPVHKKYARPAAKSKAPEDAPDKKSESIFSFGKFSQLHTPSLKDREASATVIDKIREFNQLKIFPSVRFAMLEEIKSQYNMKGKDETNVTLEPTPVQISAIRKVNQSRNVKVENTEELTESQQISLSLMEENQANRMKVFTIAAETGSGKTWAYLASVLSKLKEDDMKLWQESSTKYEQSKDHAIVRSVILVPTHQLVEQVYETLTRANSIEVDYEGLNIPPKYKPFLQLEENKTLGLSIMKWSQGDPPTALFNKCEEGRLDVLVTTPAKVSSLSKLRNFSRPLRYFSSVKYCVVDEADTLFDQSFIGDTSYVIKHLPRLLDLILVSATIPKEFQRILKSKFPDQKSLITVQTPQLHKIPKRIKVFTLDAELSPYNGSKTRCLAQALYAIAKDGTDPGFVKRIVIFVNKRDEVQPLVKSMIEKFHHKPEDFYGITQDLTKQEREKLLKPFLQPAELIEDDEHKSKYKVLVCTDALARGVNFIGVKNIVMLDLPHNSVDLVHRIGRTGRMKQNGRVFVIVDRKTRKSWIKGLGNAVSRGVTIG